MEIGSRGRSGGDMASPTFPLVRTDELIRITCAKTCQPRSALASASGAALWGLGGTSMSLCLTLEEAPATPEKPTGSDPHGAPNPFALVMRHSLFLSYLHPNAAKVEGEAVVCYAEPLTTQDMRYPRLSPRVNNMAGFSLFVDVTASPFDKIA